MIRLNFYVTIITIISLLLFGCIENSKIVFENKVIKGEPVIIKKKIDKNGNIIIEELLDKDSINNGYHKVFSLGKIKDSGNYKSGQKEGIWSHWDLNGDLIKTENWLSGNQFGEQIDYYSRISPNDRPRIYKYSFYNVEGQKIFESRFDLNKKPLTIEGSPIYSIYNSSNIKVGSEYELICFFGIPPGHKWDFSIKEKKDVNNLVLLEKNFNSDSSNNEILNLSFAKKYSHTKKYLIKGKYTYLLFLQAKSSSGQIIFRDSTKLDVSIQ